MSRRRMRREGIEHRRRVNAERDAYLNAQLDPEEIVLARGRPGIVTEHRIVFAWRLGWPSLEGQWTHDALTFDEITRWSIGRRHDHRPVLRLEHPPHVRVEWVPAHHVLWFR